MSEQPKSLKRFGFLAIGLVILLLGVANIGELTGQATGGEGGCGGEYDDAALSHAAMQDQQAVEQVEAPGGSSPKEGQNCSEDKDCYAEGTTTKEENETYTCEHEEGDPVFGPAGKAFLVTTYPSCKDDNCVSKSTKNTPNGCTDGCGMDPFFERYNCCLGDFRGDFCRESGPFTECTKENEDEKCEVPEPTCDGNTITTWIKQCVVRNGKGFCRVNPVENKQNCTYGCGWKSNEENPSCCRQGSKGDACRNAEGPAPGDDSSESEAPPPGVIPDIDFPRDENYEIIVDEDGRPLGY